MSAGAKGEAAERTVSHGTFTIERELPHPPARVFAAWADPKAKAQWFAAPQPAETRHL